MSLKNIAVEGCSLEFQNGGGPNTAISITGTTSTKIKADGKAVYKELKFSISGYKGQAITNGDGTGSGSIIATAQHVKVEGNAVLLEGDVSAAITINGTTTPPGGSPSPAVATEIVKITAAGQSKVKGA
jgi:hypothetical protein